MLLLTSQYLLCDAGTSFHSGNIPDPILTKEGRRKKKVPCLSDRGICYFTERERVSSKYSFLSITHFFLFFPFAFFSCNALIFGKRKADLLGVSQCAVQSVSRATCPGRMFWMRCRNEIMLHRGREAMIILLVVMQAGSQ